MDEIPTWATHIAAQIWCQPENEKTEMDINLCASFARALVAERERAAMIAENVELFNDGDCLKNSDPRATVAAEIRKGE